MSELQVQRLKLKMPVLDIGSGFDSWLNIIFFITKKHLQKKPGAGFATLFKT